jgi:hypothetical protein
MFGGPMMMAPVNGNPQTCALVQNSNETVVNMIVADPAVDPAPEGYTIVGLPEGSPVTFGWIYNPTDGTFTDPNPPTIQVE